MVWRAPIPMLLHTPCCSECGLVLLGAVATLLIHEPESYTFPESLWLSLLSLKESSGNRLKHSHPSHSKYLHIYYLWPLLISLIQSFFCANTTVCPYLHSNMESLIENPKINILWEDNRNEYCHHTSSKNSFQNMQLNNITAQFKWIIVRIKYMDKDKKRKTFADATPWTGIVHLHSTRLLLASLPNSMQV